MPADLRRITPQDILPDSQFALQRKQRRLEMLPIKQLRRVALGPYCTLIFESFQTMLFQVQEMLLVEKGGAEQLSDELQAYNPLIPQGGELVATVMFEIDDPDRRAAILGSLGGVENRFFVQAGRERAGGIPEGDVERTREDGKTSSVHFIRFPLTPGQRSLFRDPRATAMAGCDHERYAHMAVLSAATRAELAKDFA